MNGSVTPVDLTGYLTTLAAQLGYRVDPGELGPACAQHPALVLAWAAVGGRHAVLAYTRGLLEPPARYMRDQVGAESHETARLYVAMLNQLYHHDEQLEAAMERAERDFATACANLAAADTGLTHPHQPAPPATADGRPPASPPAGVRGIRRIRVGDTVIDISSRPGGTTRLHSRGGHAGWQATFTAGTPTQVVNAALAAAVATADTHGTA